ncbi:hypothetical protein DPMN_099443 [Dreissena polymorpha]|uniref:Uncharacterized protein n=1 Tax=Dreissena polymorpha TaxID=45954 RepID=A0A9D4LFL3_DREPO|nr:hypothetical protein DPMN_099443 [Dreissena polymorpha]
MFPGSRMRCDARAAFFTSVLPDLHRLKDLVIEEAQSKNGNNGGKCGDNGGECENYWSGMYLRMETIGLV